MESQARVKFLIFIAILVLVGLFSLIGFQLYKIIETENRINNQQEQITKLQQQLDYYNNKIIDGEHDSITGEN